MPWGQILSTGFCEGCFSQWLEVSSRSGLKEEKEVTLDYNRVMEGSSRLGLKGEREVMLNYDRVWEAFSRSGLKEERERKFWITTGSRKFHKSREKGIAELRQGQESFIKVGFKRRERGR